MAWASRRTVYYVVTRIMHPPRAFGYRVLCSHQTEFRMQDMVKTAVQDRN